MNAPSSRVSSVDGTEIAYWTSGQGSPLLLVHGAMSDHHRWGPLLPFLEPSFRVHAVDRRGRGGSGDGPVYDIAREFEDLAAVIDAVVEDSGSPVDVYGHSYGGLCAFGAATLTSNIRRLVLYEGWPPVELEAWASPHGAEERIEAAIAAGDRDAAVETLMRDVVMMTDDQIAAVREQPSWPARVAAVHTVPRELRGQLTAPFDPEQASRITVPVLMLTGSDSPDPAAAEVEIVAGAMPDARIEVLDGQQHVADVLVPEVFAEHMLTFLDRPRRHTSV